MWDILISIGNIIFLPSLLPAIIDSRTFVPRSTSGLTVFGLFFIIAGLIGQGLILSPIVTAAVTLLWAFVFLFRGKHVSD